MSRPETVRWDDVRAVVFDMDGTLYCPWPVRLLTGAEMVAMDRVAYRRVMAYRHRVEMLTEVPDGSDLAQARLHAAAADLGITPRQVEDAVIRWMENAPLRYLRRWRRPGTRELFDSLRRAGLPIAILSEFPAQAKLAALELQADLCADTGQAGIGRPKPDPAGLHWVADRLGLAAAQLLMIGDRESRDGEMARRAGAQFVLVGGLSRFGFGRIRTQFEEASRSRNKGLR